MFKRRRPDGYIPGNQVKLIRGGADYFAVLEQMLREAKDSIHLQLYIFDDDATGNRIADALKDAARRGLSVYVLLDQYASKNLSHSFVEAFRKEGIHFRWFTPFVKNKKFYLGRRLHHKVVVTDDFHCLIGGLNVSDRYNDTEKGPAWLDWALYSEGPVASALAKVCVRRFRIRAKVKSGSSPASLKLPDMEPHSPVRIRINDWFGRRREISSSYREMFHTATRDITIMSPYFLPGRVFRRDIRQATARGVKIKVILAGISDIALSKYAERYLYRWLLINKVEIYEYQKTILHGKLAVCDSRWITVGSYNLNNLSAYASVELNMDVNQAAVAHHTEQQLATIMAEGCRQITEKDYTTTTAWVRLLQRLSYLSLRFAASFFTARRD